MNHQVTRQILWNVAIAFIVMMYALLFVLLCGFVWRGIYWWRRVALGTAEESRVDQLLGRLWIALRDGAGEGTVVKETWGWMHYTLYVAFVGLFIGTSIVFVNSDIRYAAGLVGFELYFYFGDFYLFFKAAMDTFFLMLILGVIAASIRRLILVSPTATCSSVIRFGRPSLLSSPPRKKLLDNLENLLGYWYPLLMLVLAAVTG